MFSSTLSPRFKYLVIDHTTKRCIQKLAKLRVDLSPGLQFVVRQNLIASLWGRTKNAIFQHVFHSASTSFHHITHQRPGGEITRNFATFLNTSLCFVINSQILKAWRKRADLPCKYQFLLCEYPTPMLIPHIVSRCDTNNRSIFSGGPYWWNSRCVEGQLLRMPVLNLKFGYVFPRKVEYKNIVICR